MGIARKISSELLIFFNVYYLRPLMLYKSIELRRTSSYPKTMKKLICILLMFWLPLSLSLAHAMSTDMMIADNALHKELLAEPEHPCHQHGTKSHGESDCKHCGSCTLAMANAMLKPLTVFDALPKMASKFRSLESTLTAFTVPPTIKPPILN